MQIPITQYVRRFLVQFSEEETTFLRKAGFLHPMCSKESEMWMTMDEFNKLSQFQCFTSDQLIETMNKALDK